MFDLVNLPLRWSDMHSLWERSMNYVMQAQAFRFIAQNRYGMWLKVETPIDHVGDIFAVALPTCSNIPSVFPQVDKM